MRTIETFTIAISTSLSNAVYLGAGRLVGVVMPAAWTTAGLAFEGSADGVTYNSLRSGASEVTQAAAVDQFIVLDIRGPMWIKLRSGTAGSPVTQAAARSVVCVVDKDPVGR